MATTTRKLAAIMFTDIVGYTSLMGSDEDRAFDILKRNREIHSKSIEKFNGILIKEIGDGMLISFDLASDAVRSAIDIQKACKEQGIPLKIGIHEGEMVFEGKDVLGDGVNIASRIQGESASGGICISDTVYKIIRNKGDIHTEFIGARKLKNVKEPVQLYQIKNEGLETNSYSYSSKINWFIFAAVGIAALAIGFFLGKFPTKIENNGVYRSEIILPGEIPVELIGSAHFNSGQKAIAISPDGNTLVYVGNYDSTTLLYKRLLNSFEVEPLFGTEGSFYPFFSPNGQYVAFFTKKYLKIIDLKGGEPRILCQITHPYGATWRNDNQIYFSNNEGNDPSTISTFGGKVEIIDYTGNQRMHWPSFLPGGNHVIYSNDKAEAYILNISTFEEIKLPITGYNFRYLYPGYLLYTDEDKLLSIKFDLDQLDITGNPQSILDHVRSEALWAGAQYDISISGDLIYISGGFVDNGKLVYVNTNGEIIQTLNMPHDNYGQFYLSADNSKLLYYINESLIGQSRKFYIFDLLNNTSTLLSSDFKVFLPIWGKNNLVYFQKEVNGQIFGKEYDNTNTALIYSSTSNPIAPRLVDKENERILFLRKDGLWSMNLNDTLDIIKVEDRSLTRWASDISPKGDYISYTSSESGQMEVYALTTNGDGRKWKISKDGGMEAKWSHHKNEIYYRSLDQRKMMVVEYTLEPNITFKEPKILWEGDFLDIPGWSYDITNDGKFLMKQSIEKERTSISIKYVNNFIEEIIQKHEN